MQNNHSQSSLDTQAQRSSGKSLPPLSKYYYGPAQTWSPSDKSSIHERSPGWAASDQYESPSLPQRLSSTPSTYSLNHTAARPSPSQNSPQPWHVPSPPPSAPPASQLAPNQYNPGTYGLMPSTRQSPDNPVWNQSTSSLNSDTSKWGVKYNHQREPDLNQVPKPSLQPRSHDFPNGLQGRSQSQAPPSTQISNAGASQAGQVPEFLLPVAYSPNYSPQLETGAYQASPYERTNTITQLQPEQQPSLPPRIPPPLPPKLPESYSKNRHPDQGDRQEPSHRTQPESHHSETSLDQELRHYQQYSERLYQYTDSSAASVASSNQQKGEYGRNTHQAESYSAPPPTKFEDSHHHPNQYDREALKVSMAIDKGTSSEPPPYEENHHRAHVSSPPGNYSFDNPQQQDAGAADLEPIADLPKSLNSSTISLPKDKQSSDQFSVQQHSTKGTNLNENGDQSADSHLHSARSHKSSTSISDPRYQPLSGDAKPSNPIMDRFIGKIASPVNDQRNSEPFMKPPITTTFPHYSSSALGFGGPSDWEHFGDYDAEEIDDTALYSRSQPKILADSAVIVAELPVETSPTDKPTQTTEQILAENTSSLQNTEPGSLSRSVQIAPPPESTRVLEPPTVKYITPSQQPSPPESPFKDENLIPSQPSPPSRSPPEIPLESTKGLETSKNGSVDGTSVQSYVEPTISNKIISSEDRTSHSEASSQALQTMNTDEALHVPEALPDNSIKNQAHSSPILTPVDPNDKPNIASWKSENDTSNIGANTVAQAETVIIPKNFSLQKESSEDKSNPVSNVGTAGTATIASPVVSTDELQSTANSLKCDDDVSLVTGQGIAMPMITPSSGHPQIKPIFLDRRKQFRKNSQQFQEKLKRFQPNSEPREITIVSRKRPNQSAEISSPDQERSEISDEKLGELKQDQHQVKQLLPRPEQHQQQIEQPGLGQNRQGHFPKQLGQYQLAQPSEQPVQPIEDLPNSNRSLEQFEQPNLQHALQSTSNQAEGLPGYPLLEQSRLDQSESERPNLERDKRQQLKLEQPKLEHSKEQPQLEQSNPEPLKLEQHQSVQSNLEKAKLEQPDLEEHTMLQEIMLEYPWVKQPEREQINQTKEINPKQSYEKLENHHENIEQSQKVFVDRSPEKSEESQGYTEPSRDNSENHKWQIRQHEEPLIETSRERQAKPKENEEQSQDGMEQPHERTWLDLSCSNDPKPAPSTELIHEKSHNSAIFETIAKVPSQLDHMDESRDQAVAGKSLTPQKPSLESLHKSINPQAERDSTSNMDNTEVDEGTDAEPTPPSQKPSQDDLQKSPSHETIISALVNDDGIGVLYSNLDPWGRASLKRYISMLHEEAKAKTDKEKLSIFAIFINRESKLRAVLYGADDGQAPLQQTPILNSPQYPARAVAKPSQKALPALPPNETFQPPETVGNSSGNPMMPPANQIISKPDPMGLDDESDLDQSSHPKKTFKADLPVDEVQYSPGGRPIIRREQNIEDKPKNPSTKLKSQREKVNKVLTQFTHYIYPTASPSSSAPILVSPGNSLEPPKPSQKPSTYNERPAEPIDYLSKRQSAYRPYAALTMGSLDNGLIAPQESTFKPSHVIETPPIFQGEPRQVNQTNEKNERLSQVAIAETRDQVDASPSPDLRRFVKSDFDSLVSVLPSSATIRQESTDLRDMKNAMDAVPDDFSFIHQSVVAWDAIAKKEREAHERARHGRQGESERRFDELFNDLEIGYGDISELESEFKRSEAAKKADEDRHEYQTFLSGVFDVVWTRLHREIDELTPLYDEYTRIINDTLVGKDMFDESATSFALAPTMSYLLALHQKLEVRHQKAFEAVLERDRRLKKTEVSPWYTTGNVTKVKQLEKQFESAEKNAIVEYCAQRDARANKLMDVLDQNTLRGVGANQDYMECLMNGVRRVASGRAFASMPSSESNLGLDEVMKAKSATTILASSSEQIVQTFHVADMLLNAADYEVSVAKAKLVNADAETFKRLKDERSKEDLKLMRDLEHRLALIREDSRRTHDEIVKLMLFLGIQNGHAETQQTIPGPPDPAHEERIQRALQEAKRRNELEKPQEGNGSKELL